MLFLTVSVQREEARRVTSAQITNNIYCLLYPLDFVLIQTQNKVHFKCQGINQGKRDPVRYFAEPAKAM